MDRQKINRVSAILPIVLSITALGLVIVAMLTGWERGYAVNGRPDEGAVAHIFQLLVVAEVPFVLIFLATADWKRVARVAGTIALQVAALALALAPVFFLKL